MKNKQGKMKRVKKMMENSENLSERVVKLRAW